MGESTQQMAAAAAAPATTILLLFVVAAATIDCASAASGFRRFRMTNSSFVSDPALNSSKALVRSEVRMKYHMGPVLSPRMHVYIVWYGRWKESSKDVIKDFLLSVSAPSSSSHRARAAAPPTPSVAEWWRTVRLYTDQTGKNISESLVIGGEHDAGYSHGHALTRMSVQEVLKTALDIDPTVTPSRTLAVNPHGGLYLVLTSEDVTMQDFCRAVCGFHYFTFPSIVGYTLPYAWIGNSGKQCPDVCAFPFAVPSYMPSTVAPLKPPNRNVGLDGMISVIAHELAEMSSNPLVNAWYAGEDPTAPTEIADLCEGVYGTGAGGGFTGSVLVDPRSGGSFNVHGVAGRKYLVQWVWSPVLDACHGPNAM